MKRILLASILLICFNLYSQDSVKVRLLNHEIGFNTVSLIKQMVSNNPSSTLPQLPYAMYYNLYYKNLVGIRVGLGLTSNTTETKIEGQSDHKVTKNSSQDFRLGLSYNFIRTKRFVANVFGDYVYSKNIISSVNTSTIQTFPDPISTLKVESMDRTVGKGGEIGVGLKYNIFKHLSVYTEVPLVFTSKLNTTETKVNDSGTIDKTSSSMRNNSFQIILPTTVYLVLMF
jgi:hypothetical protein